MVKKAINTLACALIAALAFAQTNATTTEQKTTTQPTTATEPSGVVTTAYQPGKVIVIGSESAQQTVTYVLEKGVRYVNKAGRKVDEHRIKPGTRVHLYYDGTGESRLVNRVLVDED